jgi:acyl carrier protein
VQVFSRLLGAEAAQVGVVPVVWSEFLRVNPVVASFVSKIAAAAPPAPKHQTSIRQQLEQAADPRAVLREHVRSVVSKVLGLPDGHQIDARGRLFDLGLESLMAVELRARFEESVGCPLRPTLLFDYPTIEALVDHLASKLPQRATRTEAAAPAPVDARAAMVEELEDLREDEIAERLAQELQSMGEAEQL